MRILEVSGGKFVGMTLILGSLHRTLLRGRKSATCWNPDDNVAKDDKNTFGFGSSECNLLALEQPCANFVEGEKHIACVNLAKKKYNKV